VGIRWGYDDKRFLELDELPMIPVENMLFRAPYRVARWYVFIPKNINSKQGCQMVYFHTRNRELGIFLRVLELKMLV
jgi:hypothetical protein